MKPPYRSYVAEPSVERNPFLHAAPESMSAPGFREAREILPEPRWEGHDSTLACWWKAWELAFSHIRHPEPGSGFVSSYIDTAFNDCLFLWDSCFILRYCAYGERAFPFHRTLDNFYARQHPDGFICREIDETDGSDRFERFDPDSTGPNLFAWAERERWRMSGDRDRVARVLPALVAYHRWLRSWRTWQDGGYWATGWACGMDNQPRMDPGFVAEHSNGGLTWIDATLQQILSAKAILELAEAIPDAARPFDLADFREESESLSRLVNGKLWDDAAGFLFDRRRDGSLNGVRSVAAYWALLAGCLPPDREARLVAALEDELHFKRPHRVPSLSASHPLYRPGGDYWRGSVWAPTTYMVLRGLRERAAEARRSGRRDDHDNYDRIARDIAANHLRNVVGVFESTGTLWENWAPETAAPGQQAAPEVGWSGLPPIAVLLEFVFGLEADARASVLTWEPGPLEAFGIRRYPFGAAGRLDLACAARSHRGEKPVVSITSDLPLTLVLRWEGGEERRAILPGGGSHVLP